eukprot:TRINITY_DN13680_c0_g4_i1.p1 TRINITY_DN13680_c0_g4~~TRINITY_DN13680_c0_g4_i1.p1  ORF type:complete len:262 (+),score=42.41 TRINITY_DN13680_c0_g4_i1:68-853(+)
MAVHEQHWTALPVYNQLQYESSLWPPTAAAAAAAAAPCPWPGSPAAAPCSVQGSVGSSSGSCGAKTHGLTHSSSRSTSPGSRRVGTEGLLSDAASSPCASDIRVNDLDAPPGLEQLLESVLADDGDDEGSGDDQVPGVDPLAMMPMPVAPGLVDPVWTQITAALGMGALPAFPSVAGFSVPPAPLEALAATAPSGAPHPEGDLAARMPSIGSWAHFTGTCRPCAFVPERPHPRHGEAPPEEHHSADVRRLRHPSTSVEAHL